MKTMMQWVYLCAATLALALLPTYATAQTTPSIQGTSVADPAIPVVIAAAPQGSGFFILNQDFSLLQHSTVDASQNEHCDTGPGIYSRTNPAARTLVTDLYNAYMSGPDGPGLNTAVDAITPEVTCTPVTAFDYTGGLATQSVAANDPQHALYYLVSAFGGAQADQLLVLSNLNNGTVSSTNKFTELNEAALDTNGVYTSIVSDTRSDFGLTAITELKTSTSPGNLFIYYPQTNAVYKILGPGGVPLPAVNSFIIPPQTDGGGSLLVLVNQDGLTSSNYLSPPQDTTPFTIIDLGQLRPIFGPNSAHNTVTLPFVTQIHATTSFYAMLGAAYNPIDHRIYAVVAGGSDLQHVVESIISYDTLNPSAPSETVVADVSSVPFSLGSYPQLALNAASGTMQILTSNPSMVYSVGITGTGNNAVQVTGSAFSDSNFQPTFMTANPLQGETYIASSSGQVDILTRPTTKQGGLTLTLTGSDLGYTSQQYDLKPLALWPVYDSSLSTAKLTITVTPDGGAPVILATGHVSDVGYPGSSFYTYMFPAAGKYTIVATADASALYPAVTSPPLNVYVGNTGVYPTAISLSVPATAAATNGGATLNATVTLTGTTYAPLNAVYIQDQTGAEVGNIQLPKGVISNPITIPITINQGVQTLTATYAGDPQNQSSTSTPQIITVGAVAKVTPTFAVTLPTTAATGDSISGNLKFTSTSTTAPTGTVTIYATLSGSTTANQIATVPAAQAFAAAGETFTFTAPAAGTYTVFAGYGGDATYTNLISPTVPFTVTGATLQTTTSISGASAETAGTPFAVTVRLAISGTSTSTPTGNVTVTAVLNSTSASTVIATIPASQVFTTSGSAAQVSIANAGAYTVTASYPGDSNFSTSSGNLAVTVSPQGAVGTTLGVSGPATTTVGTSFIVTATLRASGTQSATITGNVTLVATPVSGGTAVTLATAPASQVLVSGGKQLTVSLASVGTYLITASYAGDANYGASSGAIQVSVPLANTTLTISGPSTGSTAVKYPVMVTLHGASASVNAGIMISAKIGNGSQEYGTRIAAFTAVNGVSVPLSLFTAGTYTITATYEGDSSFAASTSNTTTVVVTDPGLITTTVSVSAPSVVQPDTPFVVTVHMFPASGPPPAIEGNVVVDYTPVGQGGLAVKFGVGSGAGAAAGGVQITGQLPAISGGYTLNAYFDADMNYGPSTPANVNVFTFQPSKLTLTPATTVYAGTATPLLVSLASGNPNPSGNITVTSTLNGTTGPTGTVTATSASTGGTGLSLTFPTIGTYTLSGSYAGDVMNGNTTATATVIVVAPPTKPTYTFALDNPSYLNSATPFTITNGVATSVGLTTTAFAGYNVPVTLTVTGNEDNNLQFSIVDSSGNVVHTITPSASGSHVTLKLVYVETTSRNSAPSDNHPGPSPAIFACGLLGCVLGAAYRKKVKRIRILSQLLLACLVIGGATCLSGFLGSCDGPKHRLESVQVTATPTSTSFAPQTLQVWVDDFN